MLAVRERQKREQLMELRASRLSAFTVLVLLFLAEVGVLGSFVINAYSQDEGEEVVVEVKKLLEILSQSSITYDKALETIAAAASCTSGPLRMELNKLYNFLRRAGEGEEDAYKHVENELALIRGTIVGNPFRSPLELLKGCSASLVYELLILLCSKPLPEGLVVDDVVARNFSSVLEAIVWRELVDTTLTDFTPAANRAVNELMAYNTSSPRIRLLAISAYLSGVLDRNYWDIAERIIGLPSDYCYLFSTLRPQAVPRSIASKVLQFILGYEASHDPSYLLSIFRRNELTPVCRAAILSLAESNYGWLLARSNKHNSIGRNPYTLTLLAVVSYLERNRERVFSTTSKPSVYDLLVALASDNLATPVVRALIIQRYLVHENIMKGLDGPLEVVKAFKVSLEAPPWMAAYMWSITSNLALAKMVEGIEKATAGKKAPRIDYINTFAFVYTANPFSITDYPVLRKLLESRKYYEVVTEAINAMASQANITSFLKELYLSRYPKMFLESCRRVWEAYAHKLSLRLDNSSIAIIENNTGLDLEGDIVEKSVKLAMAIASGVVKPESIEEAGWLARAASIRMVNGSLVLFIPAVRVYSYIMLKTIEPWQTNLTGLSPLELWAYGINPLVQSPSAMVGNASRGLKFLASEAKRIAEALRPIDPKLAEMLEELASSIEQGDYMRASIIAQQLQAVLREYGIDLSSIGASDLLRIAKLSSIRVSDKDVVIDLDRYRNLIRSIMSRELNSSEEGTVERAISIVEELANSTSSEDKSILRDILSMISSPELRNKVIEAIRVRGGAKLLEELLRETRGATKIGEGLGGRARILPRGALSLMGEAGRIIGFPSLGLPGVPGIAGLQLPTSLGLAAPLIVVVAVIVVALALSRYVRFYKLVRIATARMGSAISLVAGRRTESYEGLRGLVIAKFSKLLAVYSRIYGSKAVSETHREYAEKIDSKVRKYYLEAARAYEEAKFSDHPIGEEHVRRVEEALRRILR